MSACPRPALRTIPFSFERPLAAFRQSRLRCGDGGSQELRGAAAVAGQARGYAQLGLDIRPTRINGVAGMVAFLHGQPFSIAAVTVRNGKIVELDYLLDPERLRLLDLTILDD